MRKLILDTNILVSACIGNGYSKLIVETLYLQKNTFEICISDILFLEYKRVSNYSHILKKYPLYPEKMNALLEYFSHNAVTYFPLEKFSILKDETDNRLLELSKIANADYLITGNHLDFNISIFHNTKIVSPKTFWSLHLAGQI